MKDTASGSKIEEETTMPLRFADVVREDLRACVVHVGMEALSQPRSRSRRRPRRGPLEPPPNFNRGRDDATRRAPHSVVPCPRGTARTRRQHGQLRTSPSRGCRSGLASSQAVSEPRRRVVLRPRPPGQVSVRRDAAGASRPRCQPNIGRAVKSTVSTLLRGRNELGERLDVRAALDQRGGPCSNGRPAARASSTDAKQSCRRASTDANR